MGGRLIQLLRGLEALLAAIDEPLFLHAGERAARCGRRLLYRIGIREGMDVGPVLREDADRADTVRPIIQQQPEIVLGGRAPRTSLASAQPTLGAEVLEKGNEAAAPEMLARADRQRACNLLVPVFAIDEARVRSDLAEQARALALEGNNGTSVWDDRVLSKLPRMSLIF